MSSPKLNVPKGRRGSVALSTTQGGLSASTGGRNRAPSVVPSTTSSGRRRGKTLAVGAAPGALTQASALDQNKGIPIDVFNELQSKHNALKERNEDLESRVIEAESERDTAYFQLSQFQADHKQEVTLLQKEIEDLNARRGQIQAKVDRVEKIENGIINLFLEMKDRSHEVDDGEDPVKKKLREKEDLRTQNPLVVLDTLRANLRNLLAFKEDYENELKDRLTRKKWDSERKVEQLEAKIQEMSYFHETAKAGTEEALRKREEAERARTEVLKESEDTIGSIKRYNEELMTLIRSKEEECEHLRKTLAQKEQALKHKDIKLMRISALESQIQANKLQHQFDLQKIQSQHVQSMKVFQKEINKFVKTEAENKAFSDEVKRAREEIKSYKQDINIAKTNQNDFQVNQLRRQLQEKEDKLKELQVDLRHAKYAAEQSQKKSKTLKKEYDKLFKKIDDRVKKEKEAKAMTNIDIHKAADENPNYVSVVKTKLKQKEREVQELQAKVRRLLAAEHRSKVLSKSFEIERARFESELASLRMQTGKARGSSVRRPASAYSTSLRSTGGLPPRMGSAGAAGRTGADSSMLEEELDELRRENEHLQAQMKDYDNLKSISITTAAVYERLLHTTQQTPGQMLAPDSVTQRNLHSGSARPTSAQDRTPASPALPTPHGVSTPDSNSRLRASNVAAGPTGGPRKTSYMGRKLAGVGATRSTLPVGQLTGGKR